jgi:hypothetical protein
MVEFGDLFGCKHSDQGAGKRFSQKIEVENEG